MIQRHYSWTSSNGDQDECIMGLSHGNYHTNVCWYINQLCRPCSSIYLARNIREYQQHLTPNIVQSILLSNRSNIFDDKNDDADETATITENFLYV